MFDSFILELDLRSTTDIYSLRTILVNAYHVVLIEEIPRYDIRSAEHCLNSDLVTMIHMSNGTDLVYDGRLHEFKQYVVKQVNSKHQNNMLSLLSTLGV